MKFNINDYEGKYAMHCKTQEEAEIFCRYLNSVGKKWRGNVSYTIYTTYWDTYKDQTCYALNEGRFSPIRYYKRNGYYILEFSDYDWGDAYKRLPPFKVGDRVCCINGGANQNATDKIGTVIAEDESESYSLRNALIEFDEYIDGHDGNWEVTGKGGYCWWVPNKTDCLTFLSPTIEKYLSLKIKSDIIEGCLSKGYPIDTDCIFNMLTEFIRCAKDDRLPEDCYSNCLEMLSQLMKKLSDIKDASEKNKNLFEACQKFLLDAHI